MMVDKRVEVSKKDIYKTWLTGFDSIYKHQLAVKDGYYKQSFEYGFMGEINSIDDFWTSYLAIKRQEYGCYTKKLSEFHLGKACEFFILCYLGDSIIHWFFIQAIKAIEYELYIPALSSILNGIEASIRITIHRLESSSDITELTPYQTLSNTLILKAEKYRLPVHLLAFQNESDFEYKLNSKKPNKVDVDIVKTRNDICHGNLTKYMSRETGLEQSVFTPESVKDLTLELVNICRLWSYSLGLYRIENFTSQYIEYMAI